MSNPLLSIGMDSIRSQFMAAPVRGDRRRPRHCRRGRGYIDADFNVVTLREFQPICSIAPKRIILREAQKYIAPAQFAQQVQDNPRESRLVGEAINTSLSCAGAIIGWLVVLSGTVAVPFTAGASSVVTVIGYTAATETR
jgi:hypothetical protein